MTKRDIVIGISEELGVTQVIVAKVVDKMLQHVCDSVLRGEKVELRNFGVFKQKSRKARLGRNPKTGKEVPIPARKVACFKPGKIMKERLLG